MTLQCMGPKGEWFLQRGGDRSSMLYGGLSEKCKQDINSVVSEGGAIETVCFGAKGSYMVAWKEAVCVEE